MPHRPIKTEAQAIRPVDFLAPLGAVLLPLASAWYASLMLPVWRAAAESPLCGHSGLLLGHCAPCFEALALAGLGLGLMLTGRRRA